MTRTESAPRSALASVVAALAASVLWAGLTLVPQPAAAQDCPKATTTAQLQAALDTAEKAFGDVDVEAFEQAMEEVHATLPCLDEVVSASLVAQLHRMEGLAAFVEQSNERAEVAFAAARTIEPRYTFPSSVVPTGNPVLKTYQKREASCPAEPIPRPAEGEVRVDARPTDLRPTEFPAILQVVDGGKAQVTSYLWPDDALPYEPAREPRGASRGVKLGLLAGGGVVAAAGLGSLVAGATTRPTADDDLDTAFAKSSRNDTLAGVGAALLAAGGAGIGVSFVLPTRK